MRFSFVWIACALVSFGVAAPASASLTVHIDGVLEPAIPNSNDFGASLAQQVTNSAFATLSDVKIVKGDIEVTGTGKLNFTFHGSESGFRNRFEFRESPTDPFPLTAAFEESQTNHPWDLAGTPIGTISIDVVGTVGLSDLIRFGTDGLNVLPFAVPGDAGFGIFVPVNAIDTYSNTLNKAGRIWIGYDDNGATPDDDNHDDLIISISFVGSKKDAGPKETKGEVPEPASIIAWSILAGGMATAVATRRRRK